MLDKAVKWARTKVEISDNEAEAIMLSRTSVLYNNNTPWVKKSGMFDVTMGALDGAEISELVGLYLMNIVT